MDFLILFFTTLLVFNTLLLVGFIMLQGPQDDDAGSIAAYKMDHMKMIGAAQAPNLLEKVTQILATSFFVLVLITSFVMKRSYDAKHRMSDTLEKAARTHVISEDEA